MTLAFAAIGWCGDVICRRLEVLGVCTEVFIPSEIGWEKIHYGEKRGGNRLLRRAVNVLCRPARRRGLVQYSLAVCRGCWYGAFRYGLCELTVAGLVPLGERRRYLSARRRAACDWLSS